MGYDITIGRLLPFDFDRIVTEQNADEGKAVMNYELRVATCEGDEPEDLTSLEWTLYKGPQRAPSYTAWHNFMRTFPCLNKLQDDYINPKSSDGWTYLLNVNDVKIAIDELEIEISTKIIDPANLDRAKWLIFWVREAVSRYGNEAAITFR